MKLFQDVPGLEDELQLVRQESRALCEDHLFREPLSSVLSAVFSVDGKLLRPALVLLFGKTDYMVEKMGGKGFLAYVLGAVAGNAVFEMIASTVITGAVGIALYKAKLIKLPNTDKAADKSADK